MEIISDPIHKYDTNKIEPYHDMIRQNKGETTSFDEVKNHNSHSNNHV